MLCSLFRLVGLGGLLGYLDLYVPGGGSVYLRRDGGIRLEGSVEIQGFLTVNGEPYAPCEC